MELEDLKRAWDELNERVTRNELLTQQMILDMLTKRKEGHLGYFNRMHKMGILLVIMITFAGIYSLCVRTPLLNLILLFSIIGIQYVNFTISHIKLRRIVKSEQDMMLQIQRIMEYKRWMNWVYLIGYLSIVPMFFLVIPAVFTRWPLWGQILFVLMILSGVAFDYFQYHRSSDKLKDLSEAIRELKELRGEE